MLHRCIAGRCGNTTKDAIGSHIQVDFVALASQGLLLKLGPSFQNLWASIWKEFCYLMPSRQFLTPIPQKRSRKRIIWRMRPRSPKILHPSPAQTPKRLLKKVFTEKESARVSTACSFFSLSKMYISREVKSSTLLWQCLEDLYWFSCSRSLLNRNSLNFPISEDLLVKPETHGCSLDLYIQTRLEGKSAATQTRKKNLSKGKMLSRNLYLVVFSFTFHSHFILILLGVQTN